VANRNVKDPRNNKSTAAKKYQSDLIMDFKYRQQRKKKIITNAESVEEFLARGGQIKKCKSRKHRVWEATFNGKSKFITRKIVNSMGRRT